MGKCRRCLQREMKILAAVLSKNRPLLCRLFMILDKGKGLLI